MFDLDSNGRLSSSEFNFYSMISSDEQLSNEDWKMIESKRIYLFLISVENKFPANENNCLNAFKI